jgi:4'-phosphopantetheinyl transferase
MSVSILYYKVTPERISSAQQTEQIDALHANGIANGLNELPAEKQQRINRLHKQQDKVLSLAGLQLLKIAMADFPGSDFSLSQVQFPEQAKPFFSENFDFNISHSGDIACCIVSDSHKVGIDIELQRDVKETTVKKYLSGSETAKNKQAFFDNWTRYEAIIKAANHGSIFNIKDIQLEDDGGRYQNQFWYTYPVDIMMTEANKHYTCHIACSDKLSELDIAVKQIHKL